MASKVLGGVEGASLWRRHRLRYVESSGGCEGSCGGDYGPDKSTPLATAPNLATYHSGAQAPRLLQDKQESTPADFSAWTIPVDDIDLIFG